MKNDTTTEDAAPPLPRIYVFCNSCNAMGDWHSMVALAEDGTGLAGHICSNHAWARHDMGIDEDGWKRDIYQAHYPQGFVVEWVEDPRTGKHAGLDAAIEKAKARQAAEKTVAA